MKKLFIIFFISSQIIVCQVRNIETKIYELFIFSSDKFLIGKEDLKYHPSREIINSGKTVGLNMNYNDIYREWDANKNYNRSNLQYGIGMNAGTPFVLFKKKFYFNLDFERNTFSSEIDSKHNELSFSLKNLNTYYIDGLLLLNGGPDKFGLKFGYGRNSGRADLSIYQFPESNHNQSLNKYFYSLLEQAFGRNIIYSQAGNEINYTLEYCRTINSVFNFGLNFYREVNNYNAEINYNSKVENIEGPKKLNGLYEFSRYNVGLTVKYKLGESEFRYLMTASQPEFGLNLKQNSLIEKNNVNLEISKLGDGNCDGKGICFGIGVGNRLSEKISMDLSGMIIKNNYSGNLFASTPVLGFEILPITHQLNLNFTDDMKNYLLSFAFNHSVTDGFKYNLCINYLISNNDVTYQYKVLSEFGLGNNTETGNEFIKVNLFKIDITSSVNISNSLSIKFIFNQYIPFINKRGNQDVIPSQQPIEPVKTKTNKWGGSVFNLSLIYNYN